MRSPCGHLILTFPDNAFPALDRAAPRADYRFPLNPMLRTFVQVFDHEDKLAGLVTCMTTRDLITKRHGVDRCPLTGHTYWFALCYTN